MCSTYCHIKDLLSLTSLAIPCNWCFLFGFSETAACLCKAAVAVTLFHCTSFQIALQCETVHLSVPGINSGLNPDSDVCTTFCRFIILYPCSVLLPVLLFGVVQ